MKRRYERPSAYIEEFTPNEYVAACGVGGTEYNFECNAPEGTLYYYKDGRGNSKARMLGDYSPCSAKHRANSKDGFYDGFVDYNGNYREDPGEEVIVWRGPWGMNGHATTKLDMNTWEKLKS